MQSEFSDRLLICVDCRGQFVFTAGEQIFFLDKQFKNDPKRCKPCKGKRASLGARPGAGPGTGHGAVSLHATMSRTETRTECSECHIETTVPFKPTQGRPVLCRQCFQGKRGSTGTAADAAGASASVMIPVAPFDLANADTMSDTLVTSQA